MSASTPSPVVDLIEHAAKVIVDAREEPHTAPYHWAGALYRAGMLVAPGHGVPAAPVDGEDELRERIGAAIGDPKRFTKRIADDTVYEPLRDWQLRAVMAVVLPLLAERDRLLEALDDYHNARDAAVRQMQDALSDLKEMRKERDAAVERAEQRLRETEDSWEQLSGEYHAADVRAEQAEQRLQAVDVELTRWERHAPDGHPIEPKAIDYANRMRRVINAAVQLAETRFSFGTVAIKERDRAEADLAAARQQLDQVRAIAGGSILIPPPALLAILDAMPADEKGEGGNDR